MRGIWVWPSEPKEQDKTLQRILREDELVAILITLANNLEGLSNAQLDRLLANNSQWRTLLHMKELMALGFVDYSVQLFGDAGRYQLTELGKAIVSKARANG
jgi:hypothetical protein